MVYICGCIPARIKQALAELPETLDETYERTLRDINKADWEFAHRLFQFVAVASRPLRVEELAELLTFDFKAGSIPQIHEGWRLEDPSDAVLATCSSLFTIVDGGSLSETIDAESVSDSPRNAAAFEFSDDDFFAEETDDEFRSGKVVQFAHFSVKEFLTSARLAEATDIILQRYHVSMTPAHTLATQACLGILLHLDDDVVTSGSLDKWPLAQYAARHWNYHARFEDVWRNVEDGMKQLFDPRKPYLTICSRINQGPSRQDESPLEPPGTPLHYAALWGFDSIVEFLILEHSQDMNSYSFVGDMTPLHLASLRGHVKAARVLIEHGADVTVLAEDRVTPLHLASVVGRVEIARMLIERGADVTAQVEDGKTSLHAASMMGQVEIARMLIECGADVTAQDNADRTPFLLGLEEGKVEVARMFIECGADITVQDADGDTLLHRALQRSQVEVARMLIECGANVTTQNKDGKTPLHLASQAGEVEIARMLIERSVDVTVQGEDGETPLHLHFPTSPILTCRRKRR